MSTSRTSMNAPLIKLGRTGSFALLFFLPAPIVVIAATSFAAAGYLKFPPDQLSLRWYLEAATDPRWIEAFVTSLGIAAVVSVLATAIAFAGAYACHRLRPRWLGAFELAVMSPLFFPHAALGVALVNVLALSGHLGTASGIVAAHIVCTLPFAWRPITVALQRIDGEIVEAASLLGADERRIALGIALPLARSGLVTALLFSFIISFDEVTVTMFLTGPQVSTLPVQIYAFIQENASPVLAAISTVTVAVTLLVVMLLERLIGLEFFVAHDPA
jgi:putative spermidine/putrescine transport system permease protein